MLGIRTPCDDVDEKKDLLFDTIDPINMVGKDANKSSINADNSIGRSAIDELTKIIASLSLEPAAINLLQELLFRWTLVNEMMKPDHFQSGLFMIGTLASFTVSKASLKRHDSLLLASAIIRIALEFLASRGQLNRSLNSELVEHLLGKESEYLPVASELLDSIIPEEMINPALTEKIKHDFDHLAALKSRCLESTAEKAESVMQSDATIRFTTVDDVDEKNNSSLNTVNSIITIVDDGNEKKSSINSEMCSSTTGTDALTKEIASFSLASIAEKAEIQSNATIRKLRRSARLSIEPLRSYDNIDVVRAGLPELEEATVHALIDSGLEELPIHEEIEAVRDGFRRNFGMTTRSISDQPFHLSIAESCAKLKALPQQIRISAETKRAQMVDWVFGFIARMKKFECVPGLLDMMYFSAVCILDCSLMEHAKGIYNLAEKNNRPVLIAAVKLAVRKGSVNGKALSALCSVTDELGCRDKDIQYWEDKHAKALDCNTNAPTQMQPTHLLEKLQEHWTLFNDIMKPDEFQSGWSMIEMLASFAVSKAGLLKRYHCGENLLLVSAIIRIALERFASRTQLDNPLDSELIEGLLGKESEHLPVGLELLDWVLSGEEILPALTKKMKEDFDFDAKSDLRKIRDDMQMSQSE